MIIEIEQLTIRALMERSFSLYESLPALGYVGDLPRSYSEIRNDVQKLATHLLDRGVKKGDKVAILGENSPNWAVAYLAVVYLGAVAVPVLPGFTDSDTRHIIRNSGAVVIFVSQNQRAKIEELAKSALHTIYSLEDFSTQNLKKDSLKALEKTIQSLIRKKGEEPSAEEILNQFPEPEPDDLAAIIYTSGTTGHSKGVMLTHKNIASNVVNSIEKFPIDHRDRFLSILPLAHTFECTGGMLCPLCVGVTIFYMRGLPTPQKLLSAMETVRPTAVLAVPLVIDKIYRKKVLPTLQGNKVVAALYSKPFFRKNLHKLAGRKLKKSLGGKLRFFMFGGAPLNEDVERFLQEAGIQYSTGYGMTETSPIITINPLGKAKTGSCGQAIPGIEIKIHVTNEQTGEGEILIRGDSVMAGYYNNEDATKKVLLTDGWLKTGDLGYLDSEGFLFIKGRSKNVILGPSGENIYPEIIEQEISTSPYVQEVIVYQSEGKLVAKAYMDSDVLDQELEGKGIDGAQTKEFIAELLEQIRKQVNERLPQFSRISKITDHPDPFEKTPTNKVKRYLYTSQSGA
ncbi:MAG: AMP-binding protein [Actinobacteria bacterium]|nr:AMP-binding protein [Actinomycetota bacterium]